MTTRVYSAPWVLPGRAEGPRLEDSPSPPPRGGEGRGEGVGGTHPAIRDGAIVLDGGRVIAVGPRESVERRHGPGERLDAILLPALVNAHLHLELSHMRGRVAGGDGLAAWIARFIAVRGEIRAEGAPEAMAAAAQQLRAAGVAAVGDVSNTLASLEPLAQAGICGTIFHEVLGFTRERFDRYLAAARSERGVRPPPHGLRVFESPHAVYSTHREGLESLVRAGPGSIHLAEDPAERIFVRDGTGPFRRMLDAIGGADVEARRVRGRSAVAAVAPFLGHRHLVVHCVDLDAEDVALLAASGATAVLCPRSNRYISNLLPPLPALLEAGVPLAVGTDSLASSPSLAPLAELALLRREFQAVPASRLLSLAWNGAAVGAPHVGRLTQGPAPGVLAAPLGGARPEDPFEFLLSAFGAEQRPLTWIAENALEAA